MEFQTLPFGVGEIGRVAPFHAQERTSSTYLPRFSKQFLEGSFSETHIPVSECLYALGLGLSSGRLAKLSEVAHRRKEVRGSCLKASLRRRSTF